MDIKCELRRAIDDGVLADILKDRINSLLDGVLGFGEVVLKWRVKGEDINVSIEALLKDGSESHYCKYGNTYRSTDTIKKVIADVVGYFVGHTSISISKAVSLFDAINLYGRESIEIIIRAHVNYSLMGTKGYTSCEVSVSIMPSDVLISPTVTINKWGFDCNIRETYQYPGESIFNTSVEDVAVRIVNDINSPDKDLNLIDDDNNIREKEIQDVINREVDGLFRKRGEYKSCEIAYEKHSEYNGVRITVVASFIDEKYQYSIFNPSYSLKDKTVGNLSDSVVEHFIRHCGKYLEQSEQQGESPIADGESATSFNISVRGEFSLSDIVTIKLKQGYKANIQLFKD